MSAATVDDLKLLNAVSRTATNQWLDALDNVVSFGRLVSPRGEPTTEVLHELVTVDMNYPVVDVPDRKLQFKFMAAEAYWILSGSDLVSGIAPWNSKIAQFSDDGKTFAGAYGPPIEQQMEYVVSSLLRDPDTRQAVLTIWRPNPPASKDIPCTVAMVFQIRHGCLHNHVFMRSSDVWLGLPYDIFNFSMVAVYVASRLRKAGVAVRLGTLYLTAASMHLYHRDLEGVQRCLDAPPITDLPPELPDELLTGMLRPRLIDLRDSKPGDAVRWWEVKAS